MSSFGKSSSHAAVDSLGVNSSRNLSLKAEIRTIESELKDWFLSRRVRLERALSVRKLLQENNFTGLSINNPQVDDTQRVLWEELVKGKPDLEDKLSLNAREMKADMYMKTFKQSTDLDHLCRTPGVSYMRCLKTNIKLSAVERSGVCLNAFQSFDSCRKATLQQQAVAVENSMVKQELQDSRAKALFERRTLLLDMLKGSA